MTEIRWKSPKPEAPSRKNEMYHLSAHKGFVHDINAKTPSLMEPKSIKKTH